MTSPSEVDIAEITHVLNEEPPPEPVRPRGDKTSEAELEHRLRLVVKWLSRGIPYSDVVASCGSQFGVSDSTAARYVAEATKRIRESNAKDRETDVALAKVRFETFMSLACEDRQFAAAIAANRDLVKLLGLAEPDKVEHNAGDSLKQLWEEIRGGKHQQEPG